MHLFGRGSPFSHVIVMCRFLLNVREMFFFFWEGAKHIMSLFVVFVYLQLIQSGDTLSSYRGGVA